MRIFRILKAGKINLLIENLDARLARLIQGYEESHRFEQTGRIEHPKEGFLGLTLGPHGSS